jgi:hypothetical protein
VEPLINPPKVSRETMEEWQSDTAHCEQLVKEQVARLKDFAQLPDAIREAVQIEKEFAQRLEKKSRWLDWCALFPKHHG